MKAFVADGTVLLQGVLDEKTDFGTMEAQIFEVVAKNGSGGVTLDFAGVKRANSLGILRWTTFVKKARCAFVYENVPMWLVEQFNFRMIRLDEGSRVSSIMAPFYCGADGTHEVLRLEIGKDIPLMENYKDFTMERTNVNGRKLEPDFDPADYFSFLVPSKIESAKM